MTCYWPWRGQPMKMFCMTWPVFDIDVVNQWKYVVLHDLYLTLMWSTNENVLHDMTCIWPWRCQPMKMFCMIWPVFDLYVVNQWKCFVWYDLYLTLTWSTNEHVLFRSIQYYRIDYLDIVIGIHIVPTHIAVLSDSVQYCRAYLWKYVQSRILP